MKTRKWFLGAATAAAAFVVAAAHADQLDQQVRGKLAAVDVTSGARGDFRMDTVSRTNGGGRETIVMNASRLGATKDAQGNLPVYHAVLIDSAGTTTADFGAVRLNGNGQSYFRFDNRFDDYPSGVTTITAFGGGKFELQHEGSAVLRGDIHAFVGLTDQAVKDARAHFRGNANMHATINGGAGRGRIDADMQNDPKHVTQRLHVDIKMVGKLGNPFSVVALDVGGAEVVLGTIKTHGRSGEGSLKFESRHGDTIPGGGIPALLGKTIEVRNSQGTAVLTGVFPSVP
jgi:hypothetical protein